MTPEIYIYEVDVEAADGSIPGTTWDVHLVGHGEASAVSAAAAAALTTFEETHGRDGRLGEVRYVGGVHPIVGAEVISVHEQR